MVDMYYRFTSDEEPSDEQLKTLMSEVTIDVIERARIAKINFDKQLKDLIEDSKKEGKLVD
jgi:hypothetical protein